MNKKKLLLWFSIFLVITSTVLLIYCICKERLVIFITLSFVEYLIAFTSLITLVILAITLNHQIRSSRIEKFESKYFEMVRIHIDNAKEIKIKSVKGRNIFVKMLREYRLCLKYIKKFLKNKDELEHIDILSIAYLVFYNGVGPNSSRVLKELLIMYYPYLNECRINKIIDFFSNNKDIADKKKLDLKYAPFEGHKLRLEHYYRHLYQTVKYVDEFAYISKEEKYNYIKILRAQLSIYEQAIFVFNAISVLGKAWVSNVDFVTKYSLIKNIPKNFLDEEKEINLERSFKGILFDYQEKYEKIRINVFTGKS